MHVSEKRVVTSTTREYIDLMKSQLSKVINVAFFGFISQNVSHHG